MYPNASHLLTAILTIYLYTHAFRSDPWCRASFIQLSISKLGSAVLHLECQRVRHAKLPIYEADCMQEILNYAEGWHSF